MFPCPMCAGTGCDRCNDLGTWELTSCASTFVSPIVRLSRYASMAKEGSWPVAGGVLDQSEWFVAAAQAYWHWQNEFREV